MTNLQVKYPPAAIEKAKNRAPKPTFVNADLFTTGKCHNCGDRGFMIAFFCDYEKSALVGTIPVMPPWDKGASAGKCMKWVNGAWWIGEHESFPCPVCNL